MDVVLGLDYQVLNFISHLKHFVADATAAAAD